MTAKKKIKKKGKAGRPKKEINEVHLFKLARMGCTWDEIADILDCNPSTIQKREDLSGVYKRGRGRMKQSLRRMQWKACRAGNAYMLKWMGIQFLGQKDVLRNEFESGSVDVKFEHTVRHSPPATDEG